VVATYCKAMFLIETFVQPEHKSKSIEYTGYVKRGDEGERVTSQIA
jgi:hypothetical protein